ncbi:hypothetical protein BDW02DRAFT_568847 [Decorospora gaudefroyi]|uniref:Uncharacterized protein n=1 Tax=Decorospora gaudefroyi TaxID=184978 RepID=A0A6A5KM82_9PLEO|nr:hypothetical protein BDW02DRAFT_568847 [Decorospora gaudefroyi]
MVKTNRFVLLRSTTPLPIYDIIALYNVETVAINEQSVSQFKGYMLEIRMSAPKPFPNVEESPFPMRPMSAMLLSRELPRFCAGLSRADCVSLGMTAAVQILLKVAPVLEESVSPYKDSLTEFLSTAVQQSLLKPFQDLRTFKHVSVRGHVSPKLATTVEHEMAKDKWPDPAAVLLGMQAKREKGKEQYNCRDYAGAMDTWYECGEDIGLVRTSPSWDNLVLQGRQPFIDTLANLHFTASLNMIHVGIYSLGPVSFVTNNTVTGALLKTIEDSIWAAENCMKPEFWQVGRTWRPSDTLLAKLRYRQAVFLRLSGDVRRLPLAIRYITEAHDLLLDDSKISAEARAIRQWGIGTHS